MFFKKYAKFYPYQAKKFWLRLWAASGIKNLVTVFFIGGTLTGYAISQIDQYGFSVSNGARPENEGVPRILVVLTDGRSGDDVLAPSTNVTEYSGFRRPTVSF